MKDQIISFETAVAAKEIGFDVPVMWFYNLSSKLTYDTNWPTLENNYNENFTYHNAECSAPTQSLLQKYLREEYNIQIVIEYAGKYFVKYKIGHW